jgi:site-specific recombinase XerD
VSDYTSLLFNPKIGSWTFKFYPLGDDAKRSAKNVPRGVARAAADERVARAWADKAIIVYRNTGAWPGVDVTLPPSLPLVTLEHLGPKWIEWLRARNASGEGAESTSDGYERILNTSVYTHAIANKPIQDVTVDDAAQFVEDVSKGCEDNTARNRSAALTALFKWTRTRDARRWMGNIKLAANPMRDEIVRDAIPKKGSRAAQKNVIVLLPTERFEALVTHPSEDIPIFRRLWYVFAITTGARYAEQCGLAWSHLHLDRAKRCPHAGCQASKDIEHVHIERQLTKKSAFVAPKRNSVRTLPLHPLTLEALRWWRDRGWREHVGRGHAASDAVFARADGSYLYQHHIPRYLRQDLVEAELSAKIDGFNIDNHALRRSFLTMLADAGVEESIRTVLGGHKAKTVTDRHYTARNLPRFVAAVHALRFTRVKRFASMLVASARERAA